eukprot:766595-Hanusia_phi.AAC.4
MKAESRSFMKSAVSLMSIEESAADDPSRSTCFEWKHWTRNKGGAETEASPFVIEQVMFYPPLYDLPPSS